MTSKSIERIKARDLTVDPDVQRDVEDGHVAKLQAGWDDRLVGVLTASRRADGTVVLLDGFQRTTAKLRSGEPDYTFDVLVHTGLTRVQEAAVFLGTNKGRKNVSAYHVHRVAVTGGDPVALAIEQAVSDAGFRVTARSTDTGVGCVSTLYRVVGRTGRSIDEQADNLRDALTTYHAVWGGTSDQPWRAELVEALAIVHGRYRGELKAASLVKKLSRMTVVQIMAAARTRSVGSNRVTGQLVELIVEQYDKGKSTGRLRAA